MPDPPDRLTEALMDRYTLHRELGRGGMATVYLATDLKQARCAPEILHTAGPKIHLHRAGRPQRRCAACVLPIGEAPQ